MTVLDRRTPTDLVARRVRRDWRQDITVVGSGEDDGRDWVDLWCASSIAREQARITMGAYVANPAADWDDGWRQADGGGQVLRLWQPQPFPYDGD